jgi:hypothetical protein
LAKFLREALIFVGLTDIPAPERIGNKLRERFGPMLAELRKSRPSQLIIDGRAETSPPPKPDT